MNEMIAKEKIEVAKKVRFCYHSLWSRSSRDNVVYQIGE